MFEYRADTAIVLAGGLGTRLRSVVPELPKPMAPVAGRPFLEHQFDYWIKQGIQRFIVSVGYRHEAISGHFGSAYRGARIDYVVEAVPLGTGGGLLLAACELDGVAPVLVLNGDTYFSVQLKELEALSAECDADWCFSLFRTSEKGRYMGMSTDPSGRVTALKVPGDALVHLVNGGVYLVHPRALSNVSGDVRSPEGKISLEDDILSVALSSGQRLYGLQTDALFIDIGVPDDYWRAQNLLVSPT